MGESFHIDPDAVRALTEELRDIAESAARTARDLQDALTAAGMTETAASWGDDEMGRAFAEYYLPSADEGIVALESSAGVLRNMGSLLAESVSGFEGLDVAAGRSVPARAEEPEPPLPRSGVWSPDNQRSSPADVPTTDTPAGTGGYDADPGAPVANPATTPGAEGSVENSDSEPGTQTTPGASEPTTDTPAAPATGRPDEHSAATGPSTPSRSTTGPARTESTPAQTPRSAERPAPGDRVSARSPWSGHISAAQSPAGDRPAPAAPRVSGPDQQGGPPRAIPPRVTPPRAAPPGRAGHRDRDERPAAGAPNPRRTSPQSARTPPPSVTDPAVMRIIDELAARHGLQTIGFDTAGLDGPTAHEIAAAVDQVLDRHHTIDLRALEIADLDGALPARLDRPVVSGAGEPEVRAAHIVLDLAATTDPAALAASLEVVTSGRRPAPGSTDRPLYATLVRELGRALAAAGDNAAHRLTQRTLIAEYLRTADLGHTSDSLGRIVGGYRHWRDRLSGCSPTTRFDPGAALAEAFTEVELRGDRASPPARALHQLLVDTGRQNS
ncbi:hypothetical protein [Nocardia jinanensis]|uniref:WXG100 family type VII secretion target n=1 Tax=Nocardia jinanensis TaxID=382504 RepID=A0A917RJ52_9NOCA|nr:hypothetical protein [Nocardia jinanensis]GGL10660.1 hypothetical protein GCM10011588_26440 [Nocardia jinanensis]